jgi:signal transduction histidine kinase
VSLAAFLKDRRVPILLVLTALAMSCAAVAVVSRNSAIVIVVGVVMLTGIISALTVEYLPRRTYYREFLDTVDALERKNLMAEVVAEPTFEEGRIVHDALRTANKAMLEEIALYREREIEYREYIELWVHEIKTPIASAKLIAKNNPSSATRNMLSEVERTEDLVEQTLFYARSNSVERDFLVRETSIEAVVNPAIRRHARAFIERRIRLEVENLGLLVFTDTKWASFVIQQILANAVIYTPDEDAEVRILAHEAEQAVVLTIEDNGCGILASELPRVFDKGFTGSNGRRNVASTGLGLYLVRKLADRIGLGVSVDSVVGEGTTVTVVFPVMAQSLPAASLTES